MLFDRLFFVYFCLCVYLVEWEYLEYIGGVGGLEF